MLLLLMMVILCDKPNVMLWIWVWGMVVSDEVVGMSSVGSGLEDDNRMGSLAHMAGEATRWGNMVDNVGHDRKGV